MAQSKPNLDSQNGDSQSAQTWHKQQWRHYAKARRAEVDMAMVSAGITHQLSLFQRFQEATAVLLFDPLPGEVDLRVLVTEYPQKRFYLPKILAETTKTPVDDSLVAMAFFEVLPHQWSTLSPHPVLGMREPEPETPWQPETIKQSVMVLPALAVDKQGGRLGYGKGYYDTFLKSLPDHHALLKVVPVAEILLVDQLPTDPWDIAVDVVVTENQLLTAIKTNVPMP